MERLIEEKPDDLEITSIGALYRGHWDKKYWSSSRGKDRYPYPVGYQAIRTHTGNTYKMEIREGLKGPVFAVTSPGGDSCNGQTPEIAWENFQKKSCPRVKNWHGKRFSSKIDGVELFGFRNPFVQRLLRELVANVDGVAEKSSVAPTSSSKASKLVHARSEESLDYPDLLSSLGKQQITGRRTMKNRSSARNLIMDARVKRARGDVLLTNAECDSKQEDELLSFARDKSAVCFQEHISTLKDGIPIQVTSSRPRNAPGCGTAIVNKEIPDCECQNDGETASCATLVKNCHSLLAEDEILMESKISDSVDKHIICLEQNSHISHENSIPTNVGKTLEKSFDVELEQRDSLTSSSKSYGDLIDIARNQDASIHGTSGTTKEQHNADDPLLKGLVKDSLAEVSSSSGSSNPSSEKIDLELAGQELAKSMMTFLLPRAVPLLTRTYVKRRSRHRSREHKNNNCSPSLVPTSGKHIESKFLTDHLHVGSEVNIQEKLSAPEPLAGVGSLCQATKVEPSGSSKDIKSVVADSFDDDQYTHGVSTSRNSPPSFDKADIGIKGDFELSVLPGSDSERAYPSSGNVKCSEDILLPDANVNGENLFSDSLLDNVDPDKCIPLEREFTNNCTLKNNQVSRCNDDKPLVDPLAMHNKSEPFNSEFAQNMEVDVVNHQSFPRHNLYRIDEAEHLADDTLKTKMVQSHPICFTDQNHSLCPNGQVIFDVQGATESRDAYFRHQVGAHITQVGHDRKADSTLEGDSSFICMPNIHSSRDLQLDNDKVRTHASKNCVPLSEIIICRNYRYNNSPQFHFPQKASDADENDQARNRGSDKDKRMSVTNEVKPDEQLNQFITEEIVPDSLFIAAMDASQNKACDVATTVSKSEEPSRFVSPPVSSPKENNVSDLCLAGESYVQSGERMKILGDLPCPEIDPPIQLTTDNCCKYQHHSQVHRKKHSIDTFSERENSTMDVADSMELIGCYVHTDPVLSISLVSKDEGLQICVLCGLVESDVRNLFVYIVPDKVHSGSCPSFTGYTSLLLPLLEHPFYDPYGNVPFERSGLQFVPAGQSLVFLNTVKAPRCREQNFDCLCMDCKSNYSEENIIEIVHLHFGYVTSVIKLVTVERVSCILACEPNYLIAVEESGKLHVWMMDTRWSVNLEEFILPKFDDTSPMILELKRIPNCNCLIIGHNGLGGFALCSFRDISKRVLLAKFVSPGITTFHILPVGLLNCQSKDSLKSFAEVDHNKESVYSTDNSHPKLHEEPLLSSSEDDLTVWLLVSAAFGAEVQHQLKDNDTVPVGWWRLAMLQRSMVVMGSILDSRASAVSTSSNYGIYGTRDGFIYKWELSSGEKLAALRPFTSGSVSGIAMDAKSGTVAVAGNGCQLLLYAQSQKQPWHL